MIPARVVADSTLVVALCGFRFACDYYFHNSVLYLEEILMKVFTYLNYISYYILFITGFIFIYIPTICCLFLYIIISKYRTAKISNMFGYIGISLIVLSEAIFRICRASGPGYYGQFIVDLLMVLTLLFISLLLIKDQLWKYKLIASSMCFLLMFIIMLATD